MVIWNTNPGNADRNAAGLNAGKSVGPHNDMNGIGDHVRNGADGGIMLPKCDTGDRRPVVGGDGEHRRFLMSATIVTVLRRMLHEPLTILRTGTSQPTRISVLATAEIFRTFLFFFAY